MKCRPRGGGGVVSISEKTHTSNKGRGKQYMTRTEAATSLKRSPSRIILRTTYYTSIRRAAEETLVCAELAVLCCAAVGCVLVVLRRQGGRLAQRECRKHSSSSRGRARHHEARKKPTKLNEARNIIATSSGECLLSSLHEKYVLSK